MSTFTPDLIAFQGVLISADNVQSFANLTVKGGNENKIADIIDSVYKFLKRENYINDEGIVHDAMDKMRRFAFYIVLNSNLNVLNELVSSETPIDHLIWTVPTITQYLMSEMLWKLSMGKFVYEIISFSCPQLALEVADALITNMKYFSPTECLKELNLLSTACFRMLCRINLVDFEEQWLKSGFDNFQRCMMYFCNPPNESKLERLSKDRTYKYYGDCLHTMLTIMQECFNEYNTTQTSNLGEMLGIYEMTFDNDFTTKPPYKPSECTNKSVVDTLNKCFTDILDKCKSLVMGINLDIFCAWSEFEERGVTMQETIGELCYRVRQQLLHSHFSDHPVVNMMEQISRKPVDVNEIINSTESSVIIENIQNKKDESIQWLQALIYRDKLYEDINLLQLLDTYMNELQENDCYKLFQRFYNDNETLTENKDLIQSLTIKSYNLCNETVKHDIIDNHFKDGSFNNTMESVQFTGMLTEIFNKLAISPDSDLSSVLSVFIQNPRKVYTKIFKSAIENNQQMNLMFKVLTFLEKYSNHYYNEDTESCLTIILKTTLDELDTEVQLKNMVNFVSKLKTANIISGTKLLLLIIMPKLHSALVNKNNFYINIQCNLLHKCYSMDELLEYRAPMLAMLGQVLTQVRWKINTFDELAPVTLDIVLDLQTSLINTYDRSIPDNDASWLKSKLKDLDPLNMYYYRHLWNPPGNTFVEVVSGIHIHKNMDIELLPMWLAQVLCSSSLQEWNFIWESLQVFDDSTIMDLFHNAMLPVLKAEKCNRTRSTWACILYCYKNLIHCMRFKFFKEPLSDSQVLSVINKLIATLKYIEDGYVEQFAQTVTPLLAYMAQRKEDYNIDISQNLQSNLPKSKFNAVIGHIFSNGSNN